jgi:hypothetical protein
MFGDEWLDVNQYIHHESGVCINDATTAQSAIEAVTGYVQLATNSGQDAPLVEKAFDLLNRLIAKSVDVKYITRFEGVIRWLNINAFLLQAESPISSKVPPVDLARIYLKSLPLDFNAAREMSSEWRSLAMSDVRKLRECRNLTAPMVWPALNKTGFPLGNR